MEKNQINTPDEATKNRAVFNDVSLMFGMPTGIFLLGVVMIVGMYASTRTFLAVFILAPLYYIPMYAIHKDDVRGLKVWLSVWNDSINQWECARRKPLNLVIREKPQ